jgi:hypothetical protein
MPGFISDTPLARDLIRIGQDPQSAGPERRRSFAF